MNRNIAQGKWRQMVGDAKQFWGDLTDDDLKRAEGGVDKLRGLLQEKYGRTEQEAEQQIDEFVKRFH